MVTGGLNMENCLLVNWRGHIILSITKKYNFQAEVWHKIIDGINYLALKAICIGSDKNKL